MNVFEFMSSSPWLTFFLAWIIAGLLFRCWNRFWRHLNIHTHGYPPPHCDADGDFRPDPESKE